MAIIDIATLIGTPNAIIQKFGLQVYEEANNYASKGEKVVLDFSNLNNTTTGFFHASVGKLFSTYHESFYTLIDIKGLDQKDWSEKFSDAIELVKNPGKANDIDNAIAELFEV